MDQEYQMVEISRCVVRDGINARTRGLGDITGLRERIKAQGILQPILGRVIDDESKSVEIYAGFRRLACAQELEMPFVPVIVKNKSEVNMVQMLLANVAENGDKMDLNPVDEALRYDGLQREHGMAIDMISSALGVRKNHIENRLRLLKLNLPVREAVHSDLISVSAAFDIDRLPKNLQEKYIGIALGLKGQKLTAKIDKEIEKIQSKLDMGEKEKEPVDPAAVEENIKRIKKANSIICSGLGYDEQETKRVKEINYKPLDDDDVRTLAKLLDDCADNVKEDIVINEKAQEEILDWVEKGKDDMYLDESRPIVQQAIARAIVDRAYEIAQSKLSDAGKKAKVTFDAAIESLNEFYAKDEG